MITLCILQVVSQDYADITVIYFSKIVSPWSPLWPPCVFTLSVWVFSIFRIVKETSTLISCTIQLAHYKKKKKMLFSLASATTMDLGSLLIDSKLNIYHKKKFGSYITKLVFDRRIPNHTIVKICLKVICKTFICPNSLQSKLVF